MYSQNERLIAVDTPLGTDALLLAQVHGSEGMNELFHFDLELLQDGVAPLAYETLLGQSITVRLRLDSNTDRHINGICVRFSALGAVNGPKGMTTFMKYQMTIVPKLWLLTKTTNSRIFQHMTVPDIISQILDEAGIAYRKSIRSPMLKRDYVVQYRESNYAFIARLMEEEGISYFFEHALGSHTLVFADNSGAYKPVAGGTLIFDGDEGGTRAENRIQSWLKSQEIRTGKVVNFDHTFEVPHRTHATTQTIQPTVQVGKVTHNLTAGGASSLEMFDYPGGFAQRFDGIDKSGGEVPANLNNIGNDGKRTVGIRQEQEAAGAIRISGTSDCRQLTPGFTFKLTEHGDGDGEYLVTSVQHYGNVSESYISGDASGDGYRNSFSVMPSALTYRPQRITPKPMMIGTQTALVVGPSGSEIFTDKHGRVKVHFHWDRQSKSNADSSCWVRVTTFFGGTNWGMVHVPRIGQEVVVAFEEGDPDRPIIVGSVYNARETPPYKLPDNMTQFGIKSRSSPGGGSTNFNELRFEDKAGQEHVYFHAEKDFTRVVENNDIEVIGFKTLDDASVKGKVSSKDQAWEVYNNRFEQIGVASGGGSVTTIIEKNLTTTLNKGDETHTIKKGSRSVKIRKNDSLVIEKGDQSLQIKKGSRKAKIKTDDSLTLVSGNQNLKIEQGKRSSAIQGDDSLEIKQGNQSLKIAMGNQVIKIAQGSRTTDINKDDTLTVKSGNKVTTVKSGSMTTKVKSGKWTTEAAQKITLKCGGSKIEMTPAGIKITGTTVEIKANAKMSIKGMLTEVKGGGMVMVKGSLVKIN